MVKKEIFRTPQKHQKLSYLFIGKMKIVKKIVVNEIYYKMQYFVTALLDSLIIQNNQNNVCFEKQQHGKLL